MIFSVTFIIRLKRQFRDVQSRLMSEQTRLADLDSMWKEFAGDTPSGDTDSGSTILDLPAGIRSNRTRIFIMIFFKGSLK